METVTITAPDISCDHCKNTIEQAVGELPGVQDATVYVDSKQIIVLFDPNRVSLDQIRQTLDEEGYTPSAWESGPAPARG